MSRLYKRNNSPHWWYSSGTPPHRIRISLKTTNKKTAQEIAKELDKKYTFDKFGIPTTLSVNFVTGLSIYYDKVVSAKGESWSRKIKSQLNSFREYIGDPELLSINGGMVEDYKNELLRSQAPKTTRDKITTLKNFFDKDQEAYQDMFGTLIIDKEVFFDEVSKIAKENYIKYFHEDKFNPTGKK